MKIFKSISRKEIIRYIVCMIVQTFIVVFGLSNLDKTVAINSVLNISIFLGFFLLSYMVEFLMIKFFLFKDKPRTFKFSEAGWLFLSDILKVLLSAFLLFLIALISTTTPSIFLISFSILIFALFLGITNYALIKRIFDN